MKKATDKNTILRQRLTVTVIIAALFAVISGFSLMLLLSGVPHMHIIFYLVFGFCGLISIFLVLWTLDASKKFKRLAKVLRRCYLVCLAIGIVGFSVFLGLIISGAHTEEADVDVVVILGAGLRNDAPSRILRTRLDAAIRYMETRESVPIIVTGGLGHGQTITEAEAMRRYLISRGIDENLIWLEDASTSTFENLLFAKDIMEEKGLDIENATVAVVSNEFHLFRAKLIAEKAGLHPIGVAAPTPGIHLRILYFFRETFALANEVLLNN